jgi:hypothetical protein
MKVFNPLKCGDPDFSTVESDLILTGNASYVGNIEDSVLIDFNGNVLTKAEDV